MMSHGERFEPALGWCASEVEDDLPDLLLLSAEVSLPSGRTVTGHSPKEIRDHLRDMSNRFSGDRAVGIRRERVPASYRVFYRHIGLDPDVVRTPIEAAVLERMLRGGFLPGGLLRDVLLIALIDTAVPVWALDAESVDGPLGIRTSLQGEPLGGSADAQVLPSGRLVIADASVALGVLFGQLSPWHRAVADTRRLILFSVGVAGVPRLFVEEALWTVYTALEQP